MYSNNPQSVYNGMMSGHRNMYLLSSVAIAMIGFVTRYNNILFNLCASFIFIIAAYIGINSTLDFNYYLKNNNIPADTYRYSSTNPWSHVAFIYAFFLILLSIISIGSIFFSNR